MATTYKQIMEEARRLVPEASVEDVRTRVQKDANVTLLDVREKEEYREGHLAGAVSLPRGFLEMRVEETVPDKDSSDHRLLRRRHALAARGPHAEGDGLHERRLDDRRLHRLEERRACRSCRTVSSRQEQLSRYSRHFLLPEVGEAGQAKLLDAKVLLHRRRRARLADRALPGRGRRRHDRHRRPRRRRSLEPAAPDPAHQRPHRHAEGRVGAHRRIDGAQPGREGVELPGAPELGERPRHLRAVRHHRRRLRQLPDALPGERRLRHAEEAERARQHLPVRGSGDRLRPAHGPLLPLPLPGAAAARARRRAAPRPACSACCRAWSAACRRSRRSS